MIDQRCSVVILERRPDEVALSLQGRARPGAAAPASGIYALHAKQQEVLVEEGHGPSEMRDRDRAFSTFPNFMVAGTRT